MCSFALHQVIWWTSASTWFEVQKHHKEIEVKKSVSGNQGKGRKGFCPDRVHDRVLNQTGFSANVLSSRTTLVENVSTA